MTWRDSFDTELEIRANEIQCQRMQNNAWRGKGNNPFLAEEVKKQHHPISGTVDNSL